MTLYDVRRFFNHWKRQPTLRVLVASCAAALGVKLPDAAQVEEPKSKYMTEADFDALLARTGGRIEGVGPVGT